MEKIFGIEMNSIMVVAVALFFVCIAVVSFTALRSRLMFKLGVRNIPRRRGQTALIVVGLMLSTLIISAAFATGDTLTYTIRHGALKILGNIDETIQVGKADEIGPGSSTVPAYFGIGIYDKLRQDTQYYDRIDGLLPAIREVAPVVDLTSRQTEPSVIIRGFDSFRTTVVGDLTSKSGQVV
ncbi:MAG: hypothetical protein M1358_19130, partial [Chloroflexi bacterium]|nr:hypothetical protein [Chloroflexota bacterium]